MILFCLHFILIIDDINSVVDSFITRVVRQPNKIKIASAIKEGKEVLGAHVEMGIKLTITEIEST